MAVVTKKFLFMSTEGFQEEQASDTALSLAQLAITGDAGLAITTNGCNITGLPATPSGDTAAASKAYVDAVAVGLSIHDVVELIAIANVTDTYLPVIDGVPTYAGDRYLLTAQTSGVTNGVWVANGLHASLDLATVTSTPVATVVAAYEGGTVGNSVQLASVADGTGTGSVTVSGSVATIHYATGVTTQLDIEGHIAALAGANKILVVKTASTTPAAFWNSVGDTFSATNLAGGTDVASTRATDMAVGYSAHSSFVLVIEGVDLKGSGWVCTNAAGAAVVGTNSLTFVQFSAAQNLTAGSGINIAANVVSVKKGDGIETTSNSGATNVGLTASTSGLALVGSSPNKTLEAKPDNARGLYKDANGLYINLAATNPGLMFKGGTELDAKVWSDGGLKLDTTGLQVKVDTVDANVAIGSTGLKVIYAPNTAPLMYSIPGVVAAHAVYIGANDSISTAAATADATSRVVGVAPSTISATSTGRVVCHGIAAGVLSGAAVNTPYYLGDAGAPVLAAAVTGGKRFICLGYAINATDLFVEIKDYGKKAS